jgi:enoyl-CoA hydratase/carnithine racemase
VTLNRPDQRNALNGELLAALVDAMKSARDDDSVRAVVLTGAGDKVFCAGADLKERRGVTLEQAAGHVTVISHAITSWADMRKPTICALNGSAYGGGLELALACDFRVLVEGAELALTEVRLGIMPGAGGTQRLPRLIGEARAKEMILLGRRVNGARALEIGLVNQVVPRAGLDAAIQGLIDELAACAPLSLTSAKLAIERGYGKPIQDALAVEREYYDVTLYSEDRNEGLAAFAEGRPPRYHGH